MPWLGRMEQDEWSQWRVEPATLSHRDKPHRPEHGWKPPVEQVCRMFKVPHDGGDDAHCQFAWWPEVGDVNLATRPQNAERLPERTVSGLWIQMM